MPRKPRMYIADMPAHIVQRGNDRQACFFDQGDYRYYLECLEDACKRFDVALHAYVLMTNHVHLLMTPEDPEGISRVMQSVGRRYVQTINYQYKKTGTLWEGRHKASIVDADNYLLSCYRYIELNPVRANMVEHPGDYQWSSYRHNAYGETDPLITTHPIYEVLGREIDIRLNAYRELFNTALDSKLIHMIRNAANFSMPLGDSYFKEQIEDMLDRRIGYAGRGRPRDQIEEAPCVYYV